MPGFDCSFGRTYVTEAENPRTFSRWMQSGANCSLCALTGNSCGRLASGCCMQCWRRGRDSNPRYPFGYAGFQDRSHQPLGHLSAVSRSSLDCTSNRAVFWNRQRCVRPHASYIPQTEKREHAAPASCARFASSSCLRVDRPGRSRRKSCADPRAFPQSRLRQRGSLCRHMQSCRPATQCRRRRSTPPARPRG